MNKKVYFCQLALRVTLMANSVLRTPAWIHHKWQKIAEIGRRWDASSGCLKIGKENAVKMNCYFMCVCCARVHSHLIPPCTLLAKYTVSRSNWNAKEVSERILFKCVVPQEKPHIPEFSKNVPQPATITSHSWVLLVLIFSKVLAKQGKYLFIYYFVLFHFLK